jgi:hypothetical protein
MYRKIDMVKWSYCAIWLIEKLIYDHDILLKNKMMFCKINYKVLVMICNNFKTKIVNWLVALYETINAW